jgi:outer membrane immunogenic protein
MKRKHSMKGLKVASNVLLATFATTLIAPTARAEPYVGGSVGNASVDASIGVVGFDESDSAKKLIVGYIIDLPVVDISVEGSYVDFGRPREDSSGAAFEIDGLDAFVVAGLDFGLVGVFAKAGLIAWDADAALSGFSSGTDGTDSAYGLGIRFNVASLFLRAEYEKFDIESTEDVDMLSVGVVWRF